MAYLTDQVFDMDDNERRVTFESVYMFKFGICANSECESARKRAMEIISQKKTELMGEFEASEIWKKILKKGGQIGSDAAMTHALNTLVAQEVVKASVGGAVDHLGRRGAVFVVEQTSGMAAAQGASAAASGVKIAGKIGTLIPGISAAIGQAAAEFISDKAGVENYHLKNTISVAGSVAAGAGAGALIGGPVGAAAGATVGVVSWGMGKALDAIITSGLGVKGPNDNWGYVKTGAVDGQVCIGTYGPNDTLYWKTYWNEYRESDCDMFVMSSGQGQKKSFQLCVWDRDNNVIKHFDHVYYRDFIHIGKRGNYLYVAHGKGQLWGAQGGSLDIYQSPMSG